MCCASPPTIAIRGSSLSRAASARMPADGSTATISASNHEAKARAKTPVPAPRSSTRDRSPAGKYGRSASRQAPMASGGSPRARS